MPSEKRSYAFQDTQPATVDDRTANALEFIAHYLDRIDGHLERLAKSAESGNANSALIAQRLTAIEFLAGQMLTRPRS